MTPEELSPAARAFVERDPGWFTLSRVRWRLSRVGSSVVWRMEKVLSVNDHIRLWLGSEPQLAKELITDFEAAYPFQPEKLLKNELFHVDKFLLQSAFKKSLVVNAKGTCKQMRELVAVLLEKYTTAEDLDQLAIFLRYALAATHGFPFAYLDGIETEEVKAALIDEESEPLSFTVPKLHIARSAQFIPTDYEPSVLGGGVYEAKYAASVALQVSNAEQAELVCYSYHPVIKAILELSKSPSDVHIRLLGGQKGRRTSVRKLLVETLTKVEQGIDIFNKFIGQIDNKTNWKPYEYLVKFTVSEFVEPKDKSRFQLYLDEIVNEVAFETVADRIEQIGFILALAGVAFLGAGIGGTIVAGVFAGLETTADLVATIVRYIEQSEMNNASRAALVDKKLQVAPNTENPELNILLGISGILVSEIGGDLLRKLVSRRLKDATVPFEITPQHNLTVDPKKTGKADSVQIERSTQNRRGTEFRRDLSDGRETQARLTGYRNDMDINIDQAINDMQIGGSKLDPVIPKSLPPSVPKELQDIANEQYENARKLFNKKQEEYAKKLFLEPGSGAQVHHSIELNVLKRYPNAFTADELNDISNMRGILPERTADDIMDPRTGKKQFHNRKIREAWDRGYADLDRKLRERLADPNNNFIKDFRSNSEFNQFIREELMKIRDSIDQNYKIFFSENRASFDFSTPRMLEKDRATISKATNEVIVERLPPKAR